MFKILPMNQRHTSCLYCNYQGCITAREKHGQVLGHFIWTAELYKRNLVQKFRAFVKSFSALDYSQIEDIEIDGVDFRDAPEFCDAFIVSATYKGRPMNQKELDRLNEDTDFVAQAVSKQLY